MPCWTEQKVWAGIWDFGGEISNSQVTKKEQNMWQIPARQPRNNGQKLGNRLR